MGERALIRILHKSSYCTARASVFSSIFIVLLFLPCALSSLFPFVRSCTALLFLFLSLSRERWIRFFGGRNPKAKTRITGTLDLVFVAAAASPPHGSLSLSLSLSLSVGTSAHGREAGREKDESEGRAHTRECE